MNTVVIYTLWNVIEEILSKMVISSMAAAPIGNRVHITSNKD